jgi:hypothetical protein
MLVRDHSKPGETYRRGSPAEEVTAAETVVITSIQQPEPSTWLSALKFRQKLKTYSNGSAVGEVRKPEWLGGRN